MPQDPIRKTYNLATYFCRFRFDPHDRFHIGVCRGTTCHVRKSLPVLEAFKRELGIKEGKTTPDGLFSLDTVACIGACGLAPAITVNGGIRTEMNAGKVKKLIAECRDGAGFEGVAR